jgi:hypothetical protein
MLRSSITPSGKAAAKKRKSNEIKNEAEEESLNDLVQFGLFPTDRKHLNEISGGKSRKKNEKNSEGPRFIRHAASF